MDFCETAAVVANCDLVITSDSSVAHLAGAMGVPTWLALRWIPNGGGDLMEQAQLGIQACDSSDNSFDGDWPGVVKAMKKS